MNQHAPAQPGKTFQDLVREAKGRIQEVNKEQLRQWLQENKDLVVIDVREPSDYEAGHIEGATLVPRGLLELDIDEVVPDKEKTVVTYCGGGSRSALAADTLQVMGYRNVFSLEGGFRSWKNG